MVLIWPFVFLCSDRIIQALMIRDWGPWQRVVGTSVTLIELGHTHLVMRLCRGCRTWRAYVRCQPETSDERPAERLSSRRDKGGGEKFRLRVVQGGVTRSPYCVCLDHSCWRGHLRPQALFDPRSVSERRHPAENMCKSEEPRLPGKLT